MTLRHLLCALCCAAALPVLAKDGVPPPVTAEVLPGWVQSDGRRMAALRLRLAPGWKTYWRAPGDAGIPPQFDWSGSHNLASVAIVWPAPVVFDQNGMRSIGYHDELVIPLQLSPATEGAPVRLRADMELGVCSDICMPFELSFDAELADMGTTPSPAIAAALAQQPYSAPEAGVEAVTCHLAPTADGLRIETRVRMPSAGAPEHVVIEPGAEDIWVSEAETSRQGGDLLAVSEMVHVSGGTIALDRSALRITVIGRDHAVDIRGCTPG